MAVGVRGTCSGGSHRKWGKKKSMRLDADWLIRVAVLLGIRVKRTPSQEWREMVKSIKLNVVNIWEMWLYLEKREVYSSQEVWRNIWKSVLTSLPDLWIFEVWQIVQFCLRKESCVLGENQGLVARRSKASALSVAWVNGGVFASFYIAQREWEQTRKLLERGREIGGG